ncbi:hypothetical protein PR048_015163 [Dryococelus australis]|uniref:Uncharacterized protein n=1 Tax=Dryococelus australis TaxID=614101 RepID=A0ABQ9HG60_9NEOP|nr:hypothetical protein PR048_015163 [Dryococelus australis]
MKRRRKREIPEKTRRPAALPGTIPTCENPEWPNRVLNPASLCGKRGPNNTQNIMPCRATPGFSKVEIVPDGAAGWRVFSWICRFPPPLHSSATSSSPHFTAISSKNTKCVSVFVSKARKSSGSLDELVTAQEKTNNCRDKTRCSHALPSEINYDELSLRRTVNKIADQLLTVLSTVARNDSLEKFGQQSYHTSATSALISRPTHPQNFEFVVFGPSQHGHPTSIRARTRLGNVAAIHSSSCSRLERYVAEPTGSSRHNSK